jgi:hypothetical protein
MSFAGCGVERVDDEVFNRCSRMLTFTLESPSSLLNVDATP